MKQPHFTKLPLPAPARVEHLPLHAQWLAGEGAGSWFSIVAAHDARVEITRFSPEGKVECTGLFACNNPTFNLNQPYEFTHLSHCKTVNILQNGIIFIFERV